MSDFLVDLPVHSYSSDSDGDGDGKLSGNESRHVSISYPQLQPTPADADPLPSAPDAPAAADDLCVSCAAAVPDSDAAYVVLACSHRLHLDCARASIAAHTGDAGAFGGARYCMTCAGANAGVTHAQRAAQAIDAEYERLNHNYTKKHGSDILAAIDHKRPSLKLERRLLGPAAADGETRSLGSALVSLLPRGSSARSDAPPAPSLLGTHADPTTIVDRLCEAEQTLDTIFARDKTITIAHLYVSGVDTLDALKRLGFSAGVHLKKRYHVRLPVFALAKYYGLDWSDIGAARRRDVPSMCLSAAEMAMLGADMSTLIRDGWTAADLMALPCSPNALVVHLGMQRAHLETLGITRALAERSPKWRAALRCADSKLAPLFDGAQ